GIVEQMDAADTSFGRWMTQSIQGMPPELHRWVRSAFAGSFTPRHANELRLHMRATITRLLDEWAPSGAFDFDAFASWFGISVMFAIVGAPTERIGGIKADLETLGLGFSLDKSRTPLLLGAYDRLDALVQDLVLARRASPRVGEPPDLLDRMIEASDSGGINSRQLADLLATFFVAAYDTTKC